MAFIQEVWAFLISPVGAGLLMAVVALDHALAAIPSIPASSTGGVILSTLGKILEFLEGLRGNPPPPAA